MMKKTHKIKIESVLMVTNDCPLEIFELNGYIARDRKFDDCTVCDYFLGAKKCGYQLYETGLVTHTADCEDDDGSGALPSTDYIWKFKCAKCGHEFSFYSGFSTMQSGDYAECFDCKTKHRYISNSNGIYFFAIKIGKRSVESE